MLALLIPAFFGVVAGVELIEAAAPEYVELGIGVMVVFFTLLLLREIRVPGAGTRWGAGRRGLGKRGFVDFDGPGWSRYCVAAGLACSPQSPFQRIQCPLLPPFERRDHRNPDPPRPPRRWACSASPAPTTTSPRSKSS